MEGYLIWFDFFKSKSNMKYNPNQLTPWRSNVNFLLPEVRTKVDRKKKKNEQKFKQLLEKSELLEL